MAGNPVCGQPEATTARGTAENVESPRRRYPQPSDLRAFRIFFVSLSPRLSRLRHIPRQSLPSGTPIMTVVAWGGTGASLSGKTFPWGRGAPATEARSRAGLPGSRVLPPGCLSAGLGAWIQGRPRSFSREAARRPGRMAKNRRTMARAERIPNGRHPPTPDRASRLTARPRGAQPRKRRTGVSEIKPTRRNPLLTKCCGCLFTVGDTWYLPLPSVTNGSGTPAGRRAVQTVFQGRPWPE